jgi:antitoxin (DNA-binding transcriptional repressor) of toxin-antitoxin stability system
MASEALFALDFTGRRSTTRSTADELGRSVLVEEILVQDSSVVRRSTGKYSLSMTSSSGQPTDISVRQFVADSGAVTRGLRQGRAYTLTLNGEPLAKMIPIQRRRAVPKDEVLAIFATAPVVDADELRADLDEAVSQDLRDPYEGTGR